MKAGRSYEILKIILTMAVFAMLTLWATFSAYSAQIIPVTGECVTVEDIFPGIGIRDDVVCGMDYGETRKINVQMASHIIARYNINAQAGEAYFIRKGRKITEQEIEARIYRKLYEIYPAAQLEIDKLRIQGDVYTAENGNFSIDITKPRIGGMYGTLNNGFKDIGFTVSVKGYKEVYVTSARIKRGEPVEGSLRRETVDLGRIRGEVVEDPAGLMAVRNIGAGVPLTSEYVAEKPDLAEGSSVKLVYKTDKLSLEVKGILQEDAHAGSVVKVKNADSGTIISAKYEGGRIAVANF
jgi:flagella basal body P-ring formation protein FlgA